MSDSISSLKEFLERNELNPKHPKLKYLKGFDITYENKTFVITCGEKPYTYIIGSYVEIDLYIECDCERTFFKNLDELVK